MNLREIKKSVVSLPQSKLLKLDAWLHKLLEAKERALAAAERKASKARRAPRKSYRLQYVRCGNKKCRCADGGSLHGPYWYAYWTEGGKTRSQYVGKKLPRGAKAPKGSSK